MPAYQGPVVNAGPENYEMPAASEGTVPNWPAPNNYYCPSTPSETYPLNPQNQYYEQQYGNQVNQSYGYYC